MTFHDSIMSPNISTESAVSCSTKLCRRVLPFTDICAWWTGTPVFANHDSDHGKSLSATSRNQYTYHGKLFCPATGICCAVSPATCCCDFTFNFSRRQVWIPDRQDVWRLARLERLTKDTAIVSVPGICDESFDVPRSHTRVWDPSHSLYLEVGSVRPHYVLVVVPTAMPGESRGARYSRHWPVAGVAGIKI